MKTREWYEDSIHDLLKMCLPDVPPSNIRPSYQKTKQNNPMAVNRMDAFDPMKDGLDSAQNKTDIIYFWWHFDSLDMLSTYVETVDGVSQVSAVIPFKLTVSCYGKNSMSNAIRVRVFFRTPELLNSMLQMNSVINGEPRMNTFAEEINEEWWERTDVDLSFLTQITDFDDGSGGAPFGEQVISGGYSKSTGGIIPMTGVCEDIDEVKRKRK